MALRRREALALAGVAVAAATAGFLVGPRLLRNDAPDEAAIAGAHFQDLSGTSRRLTEWRGRVLLLNFWATWCAPCREEIPALIEARSKHAGSGVEVVGIAIDNAAKVSVFKKEMQIDYPILVADAQGLDLMRKLGNAVGGLPFTVLVDRQGRVAQRKLGALRPEELEAMLQLALRASAT